MTGDKGQLTGDKGQLTGDKGQVKIFLVRDPEIHEKNEKPENLFLIMAGLSSYMLCLYAFPCKQAPRQNPTSTSFIP